VEKSFLSGIEHRWGVNAIRQTEIHTTEPLVPQPSAFEIQMAIKKLRRNKLLVLIRFQQN
jgi:hypothetical protein